MKMEENHLLREICYPTFFEESFRNIYSIPLYEDLKSSKQRRDWKDMYNTHAVVI